MMTDSSKLRLVRCPKCENLLPELADYSVYQCGGCGAVLRAKHKGYVSGSLSDEGKVVGEGSGKLEKGLVDSSDTSNVESKSGPSRCDNERDADKTNQIIPNQSDEKGVFENDVDVNRNNDDEVNKAIERQQEEPKSQIDQENGSKFSGRVSNLKNGEKTDMEGFRRKQQADMESVRFPSSNYPDEGPSNGYSGFSNSCKEL